jgi:hypothetical protein
LAAWTAAQWDASTAELSDIQPAVWSAAMWGRCWVAYWAQTTAVRMVLLMVAPTVSESVGLSAAQSGLLMAVSWVEKMV